MAIRLAILALWLLPVAFAGTSAALLATLQGASAPESWWLLFGSAVLGCGLLFHSRRRAGDPSLFPIAALLAGVGLAMVARLEPILIANPDAPDNLLLRHLVSVLLGIGVASLTVVVIRRPEVIGRYKYTWLVLGIALLAATFLLGQEIRGARLWLRVGPFQLQPSELIRVSVVIFFAAYLAERRDLVASDLRLGPFRLPPLPYLFPLLLAAAGSAFILVLQNDLGTALLLFATLLAMLFVATAQVRYVVLGFVAFGGIAWAASLAVARLGIRVQNWLDPWDDPLASGFQQVQAEFALAAGGVLGAGFGQGHPDRIPDVHTDFVLAAIGEEFGLAGAAAVVGLLLLFSLRGFVIALRAPAGFARFLAAGLATSLAVQTFLIAGGVARLIPLTGLTLPFVSYGGTSMLTSFLMTGVLQAVAAGPRRAPEPS